MFCYVVKLTVLALLSPSIAMRAGISLAIFIAFAVQWIFLLDMFAKARLPYVHGVAEILVLVQACMQFYESAVRRRSPQFEK